MAKWQATVYLLALMLSVLTACNYLPKKAIIPMPSLADSNNGRYRNLIIFLPGMGDTADDFKQQGFFKSVRDSGLPVDMIAADAHLTYYRKEILKQRLYQDIISPALKQGYRNIWIAGISMGGFGSFLIAEEYPQMITGIIAIAPWMAGEEMVNEVLEAGGIEHWTVDSSYQGGEDYKRDVWQWLKVYAENPDSRPPLYLLYGRQDRLNPGHQVLAKVLPENRVFAADGAHKWVVWKALWEQLINDEGFKKILHRNSD